MLENEIILSLLPVLFLIVLLLIPLIIFAFIYKTRPKDTTVPELKHKSFIGPFLRQWSYWLTDPVIYIFKKLKLTPNSLTITSVVLALVSGYYYYKGSFGLAGWILVIGASLDGLDGRLARATNQVSQEGAFLDSTCDRFSDGFLLGGLALYFRNDISLLIATVIAIIGTEVVSYSKARGECQGVVTNVGLMQRPERIALLAFTSIFHPFIMLILSKYGITAEYPMIILVILLAVLTNYTALVRIITIFKEIRSKTR